MYDVKLYALGQVRLLLCMMRSEKRALHVIERKDVMASVAKGAG